ncbi:MAG: hypothetical protein K0S53_1924 [Bacteroidetes bacterium]|jgi:hypothetical protein|nr:hypothetical protein [Bacteroidota bacterium]
MKQKTKLKMNCPSCGTNISVDELLVNQFEESIKKDLQSELQLREEELNQKRDEYKQLSLQLTKEKENVDEVVNSRVKQLVHSREESLKASIHKEIEEEKKMQLQELENELIKKSAQLQELNGTKAKLERLQREMDEAETRIILQKEKELTERLEEARLTITEQAHQESFLKLREREKVIEDLKGKLNEAKLQAEQGSMQLQGEIQELEIINILQDFHPFDDISQSKKGANAADILQIVRTQNGAECGKIYYESKRTKSWSNDWVKKFKQDNINTKADILVLVTNAMPKDIQRYGIVDGVWICSFNDVKELSLVLRYGLLKLQSVAITHKGKESKMELLYSYLTSEEFKNVFESIIEGFRTIQESHQSEKLKMQRLWKEREKVLEQVLSHSIDFYGSIKGIAGTVIPEIPMLEFLPKAG